MKTIYKRTKTCLGKKKKKWGRGLNEREIIEWGPLTGPPPPLFNKKYNFIH
jgi:hypothetical protein